MLVDIIAFFPFELIFVPFFRTANNVTKTQSLFCNNENVTVPDTERRPFFLFPWSEKEHRKYKHPTFSESQRPASCCATQGFCAATLDGREHLGVSVHFNMFLLKSPMPLVPSIATASTGPKAIPHLMSLQQQTQLHAAISPAAKMLECSRSKVTLSLKRKV